MSATSAATHLTQSMNINQILASFLSARLVSTFWQWRKNAPPKHHTHSPRGKKEKKRKRKKPTTRTAIWDDGTVGPSDTGVPVFPKKEPSIPRKVRGRRSRSNKTQVKNTAADNNREAAPRKKERTKEKKRPYAHECAYGIISKWFWIVFLPPTEPWCCRRRRRRRRYYSKRDIRGLLVVGILQNANKREWREEEEEEEERTKIYFGKREKRKNKNPSGVALGIKNLDDPRHRLFLR